MDKSDLKDCRLWEVNGLKSLRTFFYGSGAFEYRSYTQLGAIVQLEPWPRRLALYSQWSLRNMSPGHYP